MSMQYYETHSTDPCYNLAFEEYLLKSKRDGSILMLWQNANTIVVGLNQNTAEEINAEFVASHGTTVVRRTTGGGAVYHDLGNLNYSFIADCNNDNMSIMQFSRPVCSALFDMGIKAELGGRNDILVSGKKVSGVAQRIYNGRILHHGTLLFRSNLDFVSGALNVNPDKFTSKSSKSVRGRIGNIADFLPSDMSLHDFWDILIDKLSKNGVVVCNLSEDELALIRRNADEKYRSWGWTYGRSPDYSFRNCRRFPGGSIEVRLSVEQGIIRQAYIFGDFMATCDCSAVLNALVGTKFNYNDVLRALQSVNVAGIFGGISLDEIMSVFFC